MGLSEEERAMLAEVATVPTGYRTRVRRVLTGRQRSWLVANWRGHTSVELYTAMKMSPTVYNQLVVRGLGLKRSRGCAWVAMYGRESRKYADFVRRNSEAHKKVIASAKRRSVFGLEPRTALELKFSYKPYTKGQSGIRSDMRRFHAYIPGEPRSRDRYTVFYDGNTDRSAKIEEGAARNNIRVLPLPAREEATTGSKVVARMDAEVRKRYF